MLAVEEHLSVFPLRSAGIHRHPAERSANAVGLAPGQALFAGLLSADDVLLSDHLKGLTVQSQQFARTLGVRVKVESRQKLTPFPDRPATQLVHVIPDMVHRRGLTAQFLGVFVANANFEGFGVNGHTCIFAQY